MYDEVIVPVDGSIESARALRPAGAVARYLGCAMRVVAYHSPRDDCSGLIKVVQRQVNEIGDVSRQVDVTPMTKPVAELLQEIGDRARGSLLVMSTRGRGRTAAINGSVANDVLACSHQPVLLVGPKCDVARFRLYGPMVVATDASPCTLPTLELAAEAIETFDFEPVVVDVMDPEASLVLERARSGPVGYEIGPESTMVQRFARDLGWSTGRESVAFEVLYSRHAGKAIAQYAADIAASVVTMATHARSGLRRLAVGSVTADVVADAPCPVLAVALELGDG
jgi:nucleotide-binding universal stress UspA family protein